MSRDTAMMVLYLKALGQSLKTLPLWQQLSLHPGEILPPTPSAPAAFYIAVPLPWTANALNSVITSPTEISAPGGQGICPSRVAPGSGLEQILSCTYWTNDLREKEGHYSLCSWVTCHKKTLVLFVSISPNSNLLKHSLFQVSSLSSFHSFFQRSLPSLLPIHRKLKTEWVLYGLLTALISPSS